MLIHREAPAPDAPNVFAGEVWDIGYLGDWTVYRIKLASGAILRVTRANKSRFVENPDRMGRAGLCHVRARRGSHPGGIGR